MFDCDFAISALNHANHSTVTKITQPFVAVRIKATINHDEPSRLVAVPGRRNDRRGTCDFVRVLVKSDRSDASTDRLKALESNAIEAAIRVFSDPEMAVIAHVEQTVQN